ncbi:MAG: tandem-95 repeat protein [Gammaproteobacteria bacterium]|nr:tandem-95 repeat protein [Gammaproteobacteria bacterium]
MLNSDGYYVYYPNEGYLGPDQITFVVEQMGKKFKVIETVWVANTAPEYGGCPADYKLPPATTGNEKGSALDVIELPVDGTLDTDALAKLHAFVSFAAGAGLAGVGGTLNVADLQGAAIGQTTGTSITLDANAAGNGWFIDPTPGQNEEWLPTSNPNEWVAKAGSTAAGKMDMLSVLLHEYGHALGINHSADPNDFMGTTLTAGGRRLPSAEEMALMQSLVAEAKATLSPSPSPANGGGEFPTLPLGTSFIGFLGLLRSSRYGGVSIAPDASTLVTQYDWAANATLTNGSLNAADGWSTQGSVNIGNGAAVMNEVSGSQTRLSQVFLLNPTDRFLSFTLSGTALDNLTGAPDDAFEVALLDANTGASLLSGTGQTRTDAFLNLQADGTQNLANCVTCINNADGSRTYRVDLAGVPAGVAANLSFDLIGFGQNNSHITVSDVRLSGLPQLHDEAATMLEDGTLAFNPFAQVDNAAVLQLGSHVVDQPAHGAVTVNADGTFSYTPAADYFGTDSFTYRLSDGPLESNLATVSITLTAVNDAPVVADVQATTAEDTALVIALGAYATDVDSTTLTTQIVTGPAHGVLTQNADGSYTYTPAANYNGVDSFTYQANDGALDSNIATVSLNVTAVNDAPTLGDLNLAAVEDTALTINPLAQATDIDGDALTASIVATSQHGQLTVNADGSFTYSPDLNFNGVDSFTYKVNDGHADSNIATVTLAVAAVNDAPVAADAAVTTAEDTALVIDLRTYATDVDSTTFTASIFTGPTHGVLTQNADGSYTYTPTANYNGADSFTYLVNDGSADSNIATVTLAITAVNDAPTLGDLNLAGVEDTALAMNLLAAASDVDGDLLTASIVAGPLHGQVSINADGSFTYTPELNFNGADSFTYKANDGSLDSNIATVLLTIAAVNDAPVAADATVTTLEDTSLVVDLRTYATDVDSTVVTAQIVNGPAHGTLVANADGTFTYTPDANYNGADSFTYLVNDGALDSNIATVTLGITAVNDAPVATDLQISGFEDTPLNLNLLVGATDVDGDALSPILIAAPLHGRLITNADNTISYVPELNYFGTDSFTYKVTDGSLDSNIVTVTLDIAAVNDAPVALSAMVAGLEDTPYIFAWNDFRVSDVDAAGLGITINTLPASGMLQCFNGLEWVAVAAGQRFAQGEIDAGWLCFGPDVNESGFEGYAAGGPSTELRTGFGNMKANYASFTYQADDGLLSSAIASMTVNILPVADAPSIALNAAAGESGASAIRFATGWESVSNRNNKYTLVSGHSLEGWRVVREHELGDGYHRDRDHDGHYDEHDHCDDNKEAFVIWSNGDRMKDANDDKRIVYGAQGPLPQEGEGTRCHHRPTGNWLELGNAMDLERQAYGMERTVTTRAGIAYDLRYCIASIAGPLRLPCFG